MYCKKLYNILQDNDHITYNITETDIEKLDEFIRCSAFLFYCSNHFKYNHFFLKSKVNLCFLLVLEEYIFYSSCL